jgi:hypothetical protein
MGFVVLTKVKVWLMIFLATSYTNYAIVLVIVASSCHYYLNDQLLKLGGCYILLSSSISKNIERITP